MQRRRLLQFVGLAAAALAAPALAAVKLPAVIGDNMVLQREKEARIWGTAEPGEEVQVTIAGQEATAKTNEKGNWNVHLKPIEAGGPYELVVKGTNELKIKNVLVGEVWICSGQSNMEWPVAASVNGKDEIAAAKYPKIRLFTVQKKVAFEPQKDVVGKWQECSPQTVPGFTAVGYFFGRELHKELNVPIGLINTSWGGTLCEAWTSEERLKSDKEFASIIERTAAGRKPNPAAKERYETQLAQWQKDVEKAKAENKPAPKKPNAPQEAANNPNQGSVLYNGMINPLVKLGIRGAIWYQGESNVGRAYQYRKLFPAMIQDWRQAFKQGDFPFYFVQLAPFHYGGPDRRPCAELREAQTMTLATPNTGMAVTMDLGDPKDIHPKNKQDVGKRLALWALAKVFGKDVVFSGPLYESMKNDGKKVRISFQHAEGGLLVKGGSGLTGFEIAGKDQKFVPAQAEIDGNSVVVESESITEPVAVRYGWQDDAEPNLANKAGLPASPFRTDDWKGATANNR